MSALQSGMVVPELRPMRDRRTVSQDRARPAGRWPTGAWWSPRHADHAAVRSKVRGGVESAPQ